MGSHQNVILSNPAVLGQQEFNLSTPIDGAEGKMGRKDGFIGVLEVFIHEARDLHDICIYHKQDVYAKIFLTSDPEATESTRTINGGGQNPVFNEILKINVGTGDCSLRCEIWMLSRLKNYLEDQLLGFALVPLHEILVKNQILEKEFELSTSELFHSPSGFVKLSITYIGSLPDILQIPPHVCSLCNQDSEESESDQVSCELEKIEFPDPKVMNENEIMVSEYYSQTTENNDSLDSNSRLVSKIPKENLEISPRNYSEPEQKVVQQEIVDMYLKSMKQFTEALAKMKLPMNKGKESPHSRDKDGKESNGSKEEGPNPKVFYGSRAFF